MSRSKKKRRISDELIVEMIIQMCAAAGADSFVKPEAIAQEIVADDWQPVLKRIRLAARQLAEVGHVVILRKGKPVDPNDFKGVYRLQIGEAF